MKTPLANKQWLPSQESTLDEVLNEWVQALNQLAYWHRELTEAIQQEEATHQPTLTAAFQTDRRWAKAELIALRLDLCTRLSNLSAPTRSSQSDQTALDPTRQLCQDTQRILTWCYQIQTALGLGLLNSA